MAEEYVSSVETIRDLKKREPFQQFQILMTGGDRYVIENADALAIGTSQLHHYPPRTDLGVHMRLSQIATVEEMEASKS